MRCRLAPWGLLAWLCAAPALADGIALSPVTVVLRPGEQDTTVWLTNGGDAMFEGAAEVYAWRQVDGDERLDPTAQVAVSPQRLEVPSGGRQRLRIVVPEGQDAEAATGERSFRLVIEQKAGQEDEGIQYSLPVFIMPPGQEAPQLVASLERDEDDRVRLRIHNQGAFHVKLVDLAWQFPGKPPQMLVPDLAGYVLPGGYKTWELPDPAGDLREGQLQVLANGVPVMLVLATH